MPAEVSSDDVQTLMSRLEEVGQRHLLRFYGELSADQQAELVAQVRSLDLAEIPELIERYVRRKQAFELPRNLEPAAYYPNDAGDARKPWDKETYRAEGEELLREGKVAAFTVAGGQGSRLGYDGPKGCFPTSPVKHKPLFQLFAEQILAASRRYSTPIPWYIMTSPLNHEQTVAFFKEHEFFGLPEASVMFFEQGTMPTFEMGTGRILLAEKGRIATNPDGHGGSFAALYKSGAIEDMRSRGVEHISYFQVDNPLAKIIDPVFIGLHAAAPDSSGQMSSKMIPKAYPEEKLGVFCSVDGKTQVIEYSDLPTNLAQERDEAGQLRFICGSIAIHMMSVRFVERVNTDPSFSLPYHRAEKKVGHVDLESGQQVEPDAPNGVKLERFVFDALPMCESSLVYETSREEEFAPVKNATGNDSIQTSHALQNELHARWLEAAGVSVARDSEGKAACTVEISPLTGMCSEDLRSAALPKAVEQGQSLYL